MVGNIVDLSAIDTTLAFLHGFVTGVLGAAIRLGILGHLQGQGMLLLLASDIEQASSIASKMNLSQMWSCTPTIDVLQMRHFRLSSRLFTN